MAITVSLNGVDYEIPSPGEGDWATSLNEYLVALAAAASLEIGTFGSTPNSAGASFSAPTLTLQPADATRPGGVTAGAQTFGGAKSFASTVTVASDLTVDTTTLKVDATNNRVGIGTAAPAYQLQVEKIASADGPQVYLKNTHNAGFAGTLLANDQGNANINMYGSSYSDATVANRMVLATDTGQNGPMVDMYNASGTFKIRASIASAQTDVFTQSASGCTIAGSLAANAGTTLTHTSGRALTVVGDTTSPSIAALRITPQDAEPTGPNEVGDIYVTTAGVLKICTVAGTPGTWVSVGAQ